MRALFMFGGVVVPEWWRTAGLGIFVHWTPASVPGFAPPYRQDAPFAESAYAEWYENSLRFPGSPVWEHHRAVYGSRPYLAFGDDFTDALSGWNPAEWAREFRAAGAKYVVFVTKHHDGFCLWPSGVWGTTRDVVGEMAEAVRGEGLRFGVYYSGGLDWRFGDRPIAGPGDTPAAMPRGRYPAYARAQVLDLIDRYRPDILWNDIAWPERKPHVASLIAHYRRAVPGGVVNDRLYPWSPSWTLLKLKPVRDAFERYERRTATIGEGFAPLEPPYYDFRTPEYARFDRPQPYPWESTRGIDHSFGYNRASTDADHLGRDELLDLLRGVNAAGGNLLLNVGPRGEDATIPELQLKRLRWLAHERTTP